MQSAGIVSTPSATFTRPADVIAYAFGDLVANNTAAGSVSPLALAVSRDEGAYRGVIIPRCRLSKSGTGVTSAAFRVHLFSVQPTVTNGDNGAFLPNSAASYLGYMDVSSMQAFSDGAVGIGTTPTGDAILARPANGSMKLYALIEARGAYTPASGETFALTLEGIQD